MRSGSPEAFQFSQVYVILSWKTFFLYVHETNILFNEIKAMYIQTQEERRAQTSTDRVQKHVVEKHRNVRVDLRDEHSIHRFTDMKYPIQHVA